MFGSLVGILAEMFYFAMYSDSPWRLGAYLGLTPQPKSDSAFALFRLRNVRNRHPAKFLPPWESFGFDYNLGFVKV